jgi:tRNA pseudouridine13 synthase
MKLRQLPEDFVVEEISRFDISKSGNFKLYLLEKKCLETFSLLSYLSKKNNVPFREFGIAGLKDKHAVTKQFFTIPSKYDIKIADEENFKITLIGCVDQNIKLGDLQGNKFEITARDIKKGELSGISEKAKTIEAIGVPNYFDSQRFGSVIGSDFIAKFLIKKDYENALKIFLTEFTKYENRKIKDEKKLMLKNWENLANIRVKNKLFAGIIEEYKKTKSWLKAYKKIPSNLREMYVSAYQSYLWNECAKEILRRKVNSKYLYTIEYNIGKLLFYKRLSNEEIKQIPANLQTISENTKAEGIEKQVIEKILAKECVNISEFDIKKEIRNFFKSIERGIILKPAEFKISEPLIDEINDRGKKNTFKIKVSFILQKGSYATVITKRIFNN